MRALVTAPPVTLEVSLSLSLRRRFLVTAVPEEVRLLEAAVEEWSRRLALLWPWPEPEVRVTVTLVDTGLGDRRSLERDRDRLGPWGLKKRANRTAA